MDIYRERAHLIAYLASQHPSVLAYSDPGEPDWPVATVAGPTGQMSWHIAPGDLDLMEDVPRVAPNDPRAAWEGHSTEDKYARLERLIQIEAIEDPGERARPMSIAPHILSRDPRRSP